MKTVVIAALSRQGEGWSLPESERSRLASRLEGLARQSEDPAADVRPLLKLISVLAADEASAAAAAALIEVLRDVPTIFEALVVSTTRGNSVAEQLLRFQGELPRRRAPLQDAPAPQGSLPAHTLMNRGQRSRGIR